MRTGGGVLIDALTGHGLALAFGVPGESFLGALDAMYEAGDAFRFIVCRHEATAAHAAEAYGKATGLPGVCIVTRGPGASHASVGVHTARQDSTPLILIVGLVSRAVRGREAWQEIDVRQMFGASAKAVDVIDDPRRIPEYVSRAYVTAMAGRPGPVVLGIPEDVLTERVDVADVAPFPIAQPYPSPAHIAALRERLAAAQRPLAIVGGSGWNGATCAAFARFAEANGLPVVTAFRRQDLFDNEHALYAGNAGIAIDPALARRIQAADVLLAIGTRLDEVTSNGYTTIAAPRPLQALVHVHPGPEEIGRVYATDLGINAGPRAFVDAVASMKPVDARRWATWARDANADHRARGERAPTPGPLDMVAVMRTLGAMLPHDAVVTTGAGNYAAWSHRFLSYRTYGTQLAPVSGSMGYGIPAALAAKLAHPERVVVAFAGDGCFQMSGHELATARQYGLAIVVVVINNGIYGSIRMHQERHYPGRVSGTDIFAPDFALYARAYGCLGEVVERTADFSAAFGRALASEVPAVVELRLDPEILTTDGTLSAIRDRALAQR